MPVTPCPALASPFCQAVLWELFSLLASAAGTFPGMALADTSSHPGREKALSSQCFVPLKIVLCPNSLTCTGSTFMAGKGPGVERFWEPHGGDDPCLPRFCVARVLGFGPVREHSLKTAQLDFHLLIQGFSDEATARPRGQLWMGVRRGQNCPEGGMEMWREETGSQDIFCCQPGQGPKFGLYSHSWVQVPHLPLPSR